MHHKADFGFPWLMAHGDFFCEYCSKPHSVFCSDWLILVDIGWYYISSTTPENNSRISVPAWPRRIASSAIIRRSDWPSARRLVEVWATPATFCLGFWQKQRWGWCVKHGSPKAQAARFLLCRQNPKCCWSNPYLFYCNPLTLDGRIPIPEKNSAVCSEMGRPYSKFTPTNHNLSPSNGMLTCTLNQTHRASDSCRRTSNKSSHSWRRAFQGSKVCWWKSPFLVWNTQTMPCLLTVAELCKFFDFFHVWHWSRLPSVVCRLSLESVAPTARGNAGPPPKKGIRPRQEAIRMHGLWSLCSRHNATETAKRVMFFLLQELNMWIEWKLWRNVK